MERDRIQRQSIMQDWEGNQFGVWEQNVIFNKGSIAFFCHKGDGVLYKSLIDNNRGYVPLTNPSKWMPCRCLSDVGGGGGGGESISTPALFVSLAQNLNCPGDETSVASTAAICEGLKGKVDLPDETVVGATHTKITYNSFGLVTEGSDLLPSDIPNLSSEQWFEDATECPDHGNHTGDVVSVGLITTISEGAVTNQKLANMPEDTIKMRRNSEGHPEDVPIDEFLTYLDIDTECYWQRDGEQMFPCHLNDKIGIGHDDPSDAWLDIWGDSQNAHIRMRSTTGELPVQPAGSIHYAKGSHLLYRPHKFLDIGGVPTAYDLGKIVQDCTIYVDTGGSDVSGDGTSEYPFASLVRAKRFVDMYFVSPSADLVIKLADGVYTFDEDFDGSHSCRYGIEGNTDSGSTFAISGIGDNYVSVSGDRTENFPPESFLIIKGDTNNNRAYKVSSSVYSAGTTTINLVNNLRNNTVFNGSVEEVPQSYKCILNIGNNKMLFTHSYFSLGGVKIVGTGSIGLFIGHSKAHSPHRLVCDGNILRIVSNSYCSFPGLIARGSGLEGDNPGIWAESNSYLSATNSFAFNYRYGYYAGLNSTLHSSDGNAYDCACGFECRYGGYIYALQEVTSQDNDIGFNAIIGGYILTSNRIVGGNTVDYSPALNTVGNGNSYIKG